MRWLVTLLSLGVSLPTVAAAQELNPQAFPVGEEALGLGGAYTGRAHDASAAWYDPGGLVFGRSGSVSASLSIGLADRYELAGTSPGDFDLTYDDALGVPFYVGASIQLGEEAPDGSHRHALAATTFSPNRSQRQFAVHRGEDGGAVQSLSVRRADRTRFYGLSYALRVLDRLGVGLSAFLSIRSFEHEENEIVADATLAARSTRATLDAEGLVFRVGAFWRIERHVSLGLTFQPPGIELGARSTVASTRAGAGPGGVDTASERQEEIGARSPIPWRLRLGVSWTPLSSVILNADVALVGPLGSEDDPIERFRLEGDVPSGVPGRYVAAHYWREWTVDGAIGGRVVVDDRVPISAGFFTSLSSAPALADGPTDVYRPDRLDIFGASVSVGYRSAEFDFAIGVAGSLGFGRGLRASPASGVEAPTWEPTDLSSQTLYVFVSGAGGAITAVSRRLVREILGTDAVETGEDDDGDERGRGGSGAPPSNDADGPQGGGSSGGASSPDGPRPNHPAPSDPGDPGPVDPGPDDPGADEPGPIEGGAPATAAGGD
ncbi:MAG TPA: hypothetical protein RMH99_27865 [Sandaracinaceae bacterium LLY-WYZ-13_1]|nr:hypothetical protein [Sandaracinaceae bacterium LLY-WYZ-13_1]